MSISTQTEQLKAIGARLSEERQKKSISLEEIAARTYIPLRLLGAIETGRLDQLPEPVFIQGFIRRFADAIGLDGAAISKEFLVTPAPAPIVVPTPTAVTPLQVAALKPPKPEAAEPSSPPSRRLPIGKPSVRLPVIALGAAIGLGVIGAIAAVVANHPTEAPTAKESATAPVVKPSEAPKASAPKPVAAPQPSAVAVRMNVTEESWVEVLVDGQSAYEGTLQKGTVRSWNGKKQVVVNTGNAGGVSLSYNNSPAKSMGVSGELQTATFPPNR